MHFTFVPQILSFMRGKKFFNEIIKDAGLSVTRGKGRNNSLVSKRNECLAARYFYYGSIKNKYYEEILRLLVCEFFLSPNTISFLIQNLTDQLQSLKQKDPPLYYFQNRWPHMKWV